MKRGKFVFVAHIKQQKVIDIASAQLVCQFFGLDSPETLGVLVSCRRYAEALLYFTHIWSCVRLCLNVGVSAPLFSIRRTVQARRAPNTRAVIVTDLEFVGGREEKADERSREPRPDAVVAGRQACMDGAELGRDSGA